MPKQHFCYKHPELVARRKCFHCTREICLQCQFKIDHHLFCGDACHQRYLSALAGKARPAYRRYAIYVSLFVLLGGFLYFALLADAFYSGGTTAPRPDTAQIAPSLPVNFEEQTAEEIVIQRPINGTKTHSQTIQVEGKAPPNSVVELYLNGARIDKVRTKQGRYLFADVDLTARTNVLQTRFYSDDGFSDASDAVMIFYKASSAAKAQ
jgi:hypothetical protein